MYNKKKIRRRHLKIFDKKNTILLLIFCLKTNNIPTVAFNLRLKYHYHTMAKRRVNKKKPNEVITIENDGGILTSIEEKT